MTTKEPVSPRAVRVSDLTVRRGERVLIEALQLAVSQGEVLLIRGPNGAGKSSLLLTLAGLLRPEQGRIDFPGRDPETRPGADIHLLGHSSGIKPRLTLSENLTFWAAVNGGSGVSVANALGEVGLAAAADLEAGHLSAGQTRRLSLARLLVSERPIWLLDEPTAALDAAGHALVAKLIDRHRHNGGITITATHDDLALSRHPETLLLGGAA